MLQILFQDGLKCVRSHLNTIDIIDYVSHFRGENAWHSPSSFRRFFWPFITTLHDSPACQINRIDEALKAAFNLAIPLTSTYNTT
jgi:hypothetical protein